MANAIACPANARTAIAGTITADTADACPATASTAITSAAEATAALGSAVSHVPTAFRVASDPLRPVFRRPGAACP